MSQFLRGFEFIQMNRNSSCVYMTFLYYSCSIMELRVHTIYTSIKCSDLNDKNTQIHFLTQEVRGHCQLLGCPSGVSSYHCEKPLIRSCFDKSISTFPSSFLLCEPRGRLFFTATSSDLFCTSPMGTKNSNLQKSKH